MRWYLKEISSAPESTIIQIIWVVIQNISFVTLKNSLFDMEIVENSELDMLYWNEAAFMVECMTIILQLESNSIPLGVDIKKI